MIVRPELAAGMLGAIATAFVAVTVWLVTIDMSG